MKKYQHLFFDLDHTLWDFERNSAVTLRTLYDDFNLEKKGIVPFESFRSRYEEHNEKLWARYRKGFIRREELRWKRMWLTLIDFKIGDESLAKDMSVIYLEHLPKQGHLLPFAMDVLNYCNKKQYRMHLITNGFETTQWEKMRTSGIEHFFEEVITSESSNSLKPHPEIFEYALKATGAAIPQSLMIGDSLEVDIIGARNIGMDQVYFNPSQIPHKENITHEIKSLSELKVIL